MNVEELREYCLSKPNTSEDTPFGDDTLVFKIGGKIFALMGLDTAEANINLKCDPDRAVELREEYPEVIIPGYHMNKKHWNTVRADELDEKLVTELIDHSYQLVFNSLPKSIRERL